MTLSEMEAAGEVARLKCSRAEAVNLRGTAERLLSDAGNTGNSPETRLDLAYQAILITAKLALRASGYRLRGRKDEHLRTLDTLGATVVASAGDLGYYQSLRQKRHKDFYRGTLKVSRAEAEEAVKEAVSLLARVSGWLSEHHPSLAG